MTINELRIGNWLKLKGHDYVPTIVQALHDLKGINTSVDHEFTDIDNIEPIPLTEEWLQKFGYEWYALKWQDRDGLYLISKSNGIGIRHNGKDDEEPWEIWLLNCDYKPICLLRWIKYVHQLQNLYFVLTGNELQIK